MKALHEPTATELCWQYIREAAYFWFIAETADENMVSALNRAQFRNTKAKLETFHIPLPTDEEIIGHARGKWPAHRIKAAL